MTTAVLTPFVRTAARKTGDKLWRKRVLPVGDVQYQGRVLHFTPDYLQNLAATFRQQAYDQVAFQLAPGDNKHTNDPERYRGKVVAMDAEPDGLWMTLQPTTAGERVLEDNPELGVSARIVEDYARSDGKFFPAAVQHVLGTLDPRIPGLGAWQAIEAANAVEVTIDLSGASFTGTGEEPGAMPELTEDQQAKLAKLLEIPQDKIDAVLAGLSAPPAPTGGGQEPPDPTDAELEEMIAGLSEEDFAALQAEFDADTREPAAAGVTGLSGQAELAIELAQARADANAAQIERIQAKLDEEQFRTERTALISDVGVPPFVVDLARPLLEGSGRVVDLANGSQVDAGAVMRKVLTEFGKAVKMLDLSAEAGSALDEPDQARAGAEKRAETVSAAKRLMGL